MSVVIDASAMMPILLGKDDATTYLQALSAHAGDLVMSAATLVETRLVPERKAGPEAVEDLDSLLRLLRVWCGESSGGKPAVQGRNLPQDCPALNAVDLFGYPRIPG